MDQTRFDSLTRSLVEASSRRGLVHALAGGGLIALFGSAFGAFDAEGKKKKRKNKNKNKKKRGSCGKCGSYDICRGGTCCVPDSQNATCGGRCGTWTNNCGQPVDCPTCAAGQQCLSNGSCATVCGPSIGCPSHCTGCSVPNVEGAKHCVVHNNTTCPTQACSSTADCPAGKQCQMCQGSGACFQLCPDS
jgi:hypothetical protein